MGLIKFTQQNTGIPANLATEMNDRVVCYINMPSKEFFKILNSKKEMDDKSMIDCIAIHHVFGSYLKTLEECVRAGNISENFRDLKKKQKLLDTLKR